MEYATGGAPAPAFPLDARDDVENARKLGKRDRPVLIEATDRMTFTQEFGDRQDLLRIPLGELAQRDLPSAPPGPHRRQRRNCAGMRINSTGRIGVPTLRAACVKQQIVKVPESE